MNSVCSFRISGSSDNSAVTTWSYWSAVRGRSSSSMMRRMWACGSPRFWNSITYTSPMTFPMTLFLSKSLRRASSFILKTLAKISGHSCALSPGGSASNTSGHLGLHVIVMKYDGFPNSRTIAIASQYRWMLSRGLPLYVEGRMTCFPEIPNSFAANAALTSLYLSAFNSFWWLRMKSNFCCSINKYEDKIHSWVNLPWRKIMSRVSVPRLCNRYFRNSCAVILLRYVVPSCRSETLSWKYIP